jgi:hypothetical protein
MLLLVMRTLTRSPSSRTMIALQAAIPRATVYGRDSVRTQVVSSVLQAMSGASLSALEDSK